MGNGAGPISTGTLTIIDVDLDGDKNIGSISLSAPSAVTISNGQFCFSKLPNTVSGQFASSGDMVFGNTGLFADGAANNSGSDPTKILDIENVLVSALNRGVANRACPGISPYQNSICWSTENNWYPDSADAAMNHYANFMHTATIGGVGGSGGLPLYSRPENAVQSAQNKLMGMAYGFGYDENPTYGGPTGQPQVPPEWGAIASGSILTLTFGPWKSSHLTSYTMNLRDYRLTTVFPVPLEDWLDRLSIFDGRVAGRIFDDDRRPGRASGR